MELVVADPKDFGGIRVREVSCDHALSPSGLETDYSLNPYRGCTHGCLYCYAPCVIRETREWGIFVDVKRNIPNVLARELRSGIGGSVRLGSVTDPYQKVEESYGLTRMCLMQLKKKGIPVVIQTKSELVTRDMDLFREMEADVGMTVTSLSDDFTARFEPGASPPEARIRALERMGSAGVKTWAFIGPLIPGENDNMVMLEELGERLREAGVREIYLDKLNMREGIWTRFERCLDGERLARYRTILRSNNSYFTDLKVKLEDIGKTVF